MVQLHIQAKRVSCNDELIDDAWQQFAAAISRQVGFERVELLADREDKDNVEIVIVFESEELRRRWVEKPEHDEAWGRVRRCIDDVSICRYDVLCAT